MSRKDDSRQATETLEEISSVFDRSADWVATNPQLVLSILGAVLLSAAGAGYWTHAVEERRLVAAEAVGLVQAEYLQAMGASPLGAFFTEPANEETARETRREFAGRLQAVADEHAGTAAAFAGRLEAAALLAEADDTEAALEIWRALGERAEGARGPLHALALERLARALEGADPTAASQLYERVAASEQYPGALRALAHAARSAADAGDRARALALFDELEARTPDEDDEDALRPPSGTEVPAYILTRLRELRISPEDKRGAQEAASEDAPATSAPQLDADDLQLQLEPVAE